tara:strand:- start:87 stop:1442 length:1356 start_codon:yes stop_codon:yes gene_type:complete
MIVEKLKIQELLDINYYYSSDKINLFNGSIKNKYFLKNLYYSIFLFFAIWFFKFRYFFSAKKKINPNQVLLFSFTKNQKDSLKNLLSVRSDSMLFGNKMNADYILPEYKAFFYSLPYFLKVYKIYKNSKGYIKLSFKYAYFKYWLTYGYFKMLVCFFNDNKVKLAIVSSDHSMRTRVVAYAAKSCEIKSVYIQHASVSTNFPKLIFDYALLEGNDALYKYKEIGNIESDIFLLGSLKLGGEKKINNNLTIQTIGVCIDLVSDLSIVDDLIVELLRHFSSINIILRPHPREERLNSIRNLQVKHNISISYSNKIDVIHFLEKVDCIVSGESNIHLEATLMNIIPIYYSFSIQRNSTKDVYGFIANKLIKYMANDLQELIGVINDLKIKKPNIRNRAKYYDASIGTCFDGNTIMLYDQVTSSIKDNSLDFINENFDLYLDNGVKVYTLKVLKK